MRVCTNPHTFFTYTLYGILPFDDCNGTYRYLLFDRLLYQAQFEYEMSQEFLDKYVSKSKLLLLKSKGIEPFTNKIISNKVDLIIR
jgi:hypothetical protein